MGFGSPSTTWMPYSVSMPQTLGMATSRPYPGPCSEILTGTHPLDRPTALGLVAVPDERADVHDTLALLARDLRPVVGIGGVGKILVLLVLLPDRLEEVIGADPPGLLGDGALDGQLLGPSHDVLDHGPRREVAVVEDLLVAVLVGHLEEPVLLVVPVHLGHGGLDHGLSGLGRVAPTQGADLLGVERQVRGQVAGEDLGRGHLVGAFDPDLHVEAAG